MSVRRLAWVVSAAVVTIVSRAAFAQDGDPARPVVVVVEQGVSGVASGDVRAAVARELGVPAVGIADASAPRARGMLTIAVDEDRKLVVVYRDASGRELWRTIAAPDDPIGVVGTIALLAGNLARDESTELLGALGATVAAPAPVSPSAPASGPVVIVPQFATSPAPPAPPAPPARPAVPPVAAIAPVDDGEPQTGWYGAVLGATSFTDQSLYARFEVSGEHRWDSLSLGATFMAGFGSSTTETVGGMPLPGGGTSSYELHSGDARRFALLVTGEKRVIDGGVSLDVGIGAGALVYGFQSHGAGYSELQPCVRALATLGIPIGHSFELLARFDMLTAFDSLGGGDFVTEAPWELGVSAGARLRL